MKKLVYVNACIRGKDSRTLKIATPIVNELKKQYELEEFVLNELPLCITNEKIIKDKNNGIIDKSALSWAKSVRDADLLLIAAPFWDMSIPAALKVFLEQCSIFDITFKSDDQRCYGNCKANQLIYITTRGMDISTRDRLDQGSSYLDALMWLWGIENVKVISAQNMDYDSPEKNQEKINKAIDEGLAYCKTI